MTSYRFPSAFTESISYTHYLQYIFPSICSMVAVSFYTTVDGFFVSRFVDSNALAAINIIIPYSCLIYAVAMMLATGAGAYISMEMGEGQYEKASGHFTFITLVLLLIGIGMVSLSLIFLTPLLKLLGSTELLDPYTKAYGLCTIAAVIPMMFKLFLEQLVRVDGHPKLSFRMSICGLLANVLMDALFTIVIPLGITGAGIGTLLSIFISTLMGVNHFRKDTSANLHFVRPLWEMHFLGRSAINGASQFFTELSTGVVTLLFNLSVLGLTGENGVAAVSIIMFLYYFFDAIDMGISSGVAPVISYSRGAENPLKEREILRQTTITLGWLSPLIALVSFAASPLLIRVFTADPAVLNIAVPGNRIYSLCYLFAGTNIVAAGYYTAIGRGKLAGVLSTLRCLVFSGLSILILGRYFGMTGIWLSTPVAELGTALVILSIFLIHKKSGNYRDRECSPS